MNDILIRKCTINDVDKVLELQVKWELEEITYGFVPDVKDEIIKKLEGYYFVAEKDNIIVGFISGTKHKSDGSVIIQANQDYLEIDDVYVKSEFRKHGIGSLLIDNLIENAKRDGIDSFMVYSATKDLDAIVSFYKKHKFKSWYVQMFR